ncbi:MAG: peptidoglycan-associated lipoprotein Pal [Rudaea sp.]|uniref:peptidoglycan-associated lipoprotein Pal n=1 Tax=Rudaea sp. TaxID=2136325 RepID=UPI0039E60FFA
MKTPFRVLLTTVAATAALAACSSNKPKPPPPPVDNGPVATTAPTSNGRYTVDSLDKDPCLRQRVIYFDLDKTEIHSEFQAQIACHAEYLREFPGAKVTLEGNADERGTRDYNQGLGERRGNAVSSALSAAGASVSQINVVSYGEERPVCREHNEGCWQKNRRVEIVYTSKQ